MTTWQRIRDSGEFSPIELKAIRWAARRVLRKWSAMGAWDIDDLLQEGVLAVLRARKSMTGKTDGQKSAYMEKTAHGEIMKAAQAGLAVRYPDNIPDNAARFCEMEFDPCGHGEPNPPPEWHQAFAKEVGERLSPTHREAVGRMFGLWEYPKAFRGDSGGIDFATLYCRQRTGVKLLREYYTGTPAARNRRELETAS